jgi:hypothetical protein
LQKKLLLSMMMPIEQVRKLKKMADSREDVQFHALIFVER